MKRLFTTFFLCLLLASAASNSLAQNTHSQELRASRQLHKRIPAPFLTEKTYVPMGSKNSPLANEVLGYFSAEAVDGNMLVQDKITVFNLPDTSEITDGNPPESNGIYITNQYLERFTTTLSNIYIDSVRIGLIVDTVPVKLTSFVYADTTNASGNPVPSIQRGSLASASLTKANLIMGDSLIHFYTIKYNHKHIDLSTTVDPSVFYISISSLASTSGNPFFANPPTSKNISRVLTDFILVDQRSFDPETDRMYSTRTRDDGQWVYYGAVAQGIDQDGDGNADQFFFPNIFMIAYISDGVNGVNDTKLEGNALAQNYPNPFNPSTEIKYSLATESKVSLKVYNALGSEVATLVDRSEGAGEHNVNFNADNLPSGTYFYTLKAGTFSQTKRMVLSK